MVGSKLVKTVIERSLIPLNSLLLFFVIFEPRIMLPGWLQVFGRMHPLVLHFPIVLVLIYAVLTIFFPARLTKEHWYRSAADAMLLAAAVTASITALMGFALSRNESYDPEALAWHKWTGVFIPFLLYIFYGTRKWLLSNIHVARGISVALTLLISLAGHHGAVITHGENFILAPLTPVSVRILPAFEDAYVYTDLVQPILESKCVSCHNSKKSKGELIMDTRDLFMKGGKEGVPWDTTREDLGIMMRRIHLPLDNKEHMPPKGKPQLTDEETFVIHEWIKRGANFEQKFTDLLPSDTLYVIGQKKLPSGAEEKYDFAAADDQLIQKLNNINRVVSPIAIGSPALAVTFYNKSQFKIAALKELAPISEKIVELNLLQMDVKDEDLAVISQFKNLRELNLNFTSITGKTLNELRSLPFLKTLSLSGTSVEYAQVRQLQEFPKLTRVYLWSTPAATEKFDDLEKKNKNIAYYAGFTEDTVVLQLTPPILENEEKIITEPTPLKLKHYIRGTVVRYSFDGEDPDSTSSLLYAPGVMVDSNVTVKAKAFKPGWISSNVLEYHFYKKTHVPDSVQLLTKPHADYTAKKGRTINDNEKSDMDAKSGKWLGYDKNRFEALLRFEKPVTARNVTFSVYEDLGAWIFPPLKIEVWGGNDANSLKLLTTLRPKQPKEMEGRKMRPILCSFPATTVKYLKLVANPVRSLPAWHDEKGKNGYFFVDEVFVN